MDAQDFGPCSSACPASAHDESGGTKPFLSCVEPMTRKLFLLVTRVTNVDPAPVYGPCSPHPPMFCTSGTSASPVLGHGLSAPRSRAVKPPAWLDSGALLVLWPGPWGPKPP